MMIKRNTIKQNVDILAEKSKKEENGIKNNTIQCYVCHRSINESKLPVSCSKDGCPFR